jgi:phosphoglycolate phosphatase-like HAD superfamily hydrolase
MRADIEAVVFDLDGTLLDRRRSFERFVRDQWERSRARELPGCRQSGVARGVTREQLKPMVSSTS